RNAPAAALGDDELARSHGVLCPGHEGVAAPCHRRGARVVSLAREGHPLAAVAHDALDDTDGDPGRLEVRSLLDVKLDVGSERLGIAASLGRVVGVEAGPGHGIDEPLAVGRAELGDVLDVELARERARAEETRVAPFLVAPRRL